MFKSLVQVTHIKIMNRKLSDECSWIGLLLKVVQLELDYIFKWKVIKWKSVEDASRVDSFEWCGPNKTCDDVFLEQGSLLYLCHSIHLIDFSINFLSIIPQLLTFFCVSPSVHENADDKRAQMSRLPKPRLNNSLKFVQCHQNYIIFTTIFTIKVINTVISHT